MTKNSPRLTEISNIIKECSDEEIEAVGLLLEILRSDDVKAKQALQIMMNQIVKNFGKKDL